MSLNPPVRRTAAEEAELVLFQGIMDGTIPPGAPLRLQELASQLDMSMMPIREALRRLQSHGLVEIVAHRGAWVRPLTLEDLFDTYFTRMHLEGLSLLAAADRFGPEDAERGRALLEEKRAADQRGDLIASRDLHERFHFTLYEASASAWLVRSIQPVWRNSERYRVKSMGDAEHFRRRDAEHRLMLGSLQEGHGVAAVRHLVSHLRSSVDLVASTVAPSESRPTMALPTVEDIVGARREASSAERDQPALIS